jgi:hypothetical protein
MSLFDTFAADCAYILNEIGRTVTFRGVEVKVIVAEPGSADLLAVGGFSAASSTQTFKFLRASYSAALPNEGELITYDGKKYVIGDVDSRPLAPWVKVDAKRWDA